MQEIYYPSEDGRTTIHAVIWATEQSPVGVVQIVHGMAEYAERYEKLALYLNQFGYVVCAEDHLGHGKSVLSCDELGYFTKGDGREVVLADIKKLTHLMKEKYSGVPYILAGHSMGSYLTRIYLSRYGEDVDGGIIMGTGYESRIVTSTGKFVTRLVAFFKGWNYRSKLINNLAFGSYNKRIKNKRTEYDWLSESESNVDYYLNDKLCGVPFTCSGFMGLFSIVNEACKSKTYKAIPKDLPVLLLAGAEDPVGGYSKGVKKLYDKLVANGNEDVSMTLYENARHEIINDNCSPQVFEDIKDFLDDITK